MAEGKHLIKEWLNEYASLQDHEIKSFAAEHEHNHEISTAIFNLLNAEEEGQPSSSKPDIDEEVRCEINNIILCITNLSMPFILQ